MQLESVNSNDHVVVVMGPTGCGKTTFITKATGQGHSEINHGLRTATSGIRTIRTTHPKDGHPVVFVDTPGFDDTYIPDNETLSKVADWLVKVHKENVKIGTVIYLHRITDNRMAATLLSNLQMFASLCGTNAMPNAVIATTMWSEVSEQVGVRREQELKGHFWKEMLADGCRPKRFEDTCESAWDIVGNHSSTTLCLPTEIADSGKLLEETAAYDALNDGLPKWIVDLKKAVQKSLIWGR